MSASYCISATSTALTAALDNARENNDDDGTRVGKQARRSSTTAIVGDDGDCTVK